MVKAVIFDFDGLLVDSEPVFYEMYRETLAGYGYSITAQEYAQTYCGRPKIKNVTTFLQTYNIPWTLQQGMDYFTEKGRELFNRAIPLKKGAIELLDYLKANGYKMAVASSNTRERAGNILRLDKIDHYFDACVFIDDVTKGKPDPQVFLKAAEKLGVEPEYCLVLEDSESGVEAGHNAGMQVICIPDLKQPDEYHVSLATRVMDSLDQVIGYLG